MDLAPGTAVAPELRLAHKLGEGAMGSIWSAQHLGLGRQVAVKFVAANLRLENPQAFDRFQREAEVLDGFSHPNVVQLFGRGQTAGGDPFIVMELLDGEPLVDRLEREGVLAMPEMSRLVTQVGGALSAVHDKGIVHRDVKAENIFVEGEEDGLFFKLFDFGLAKKPGESQGGKALTGLGMMVGTAEYMSPEQIVSSRDADHHADLWALAVVSYVSLVAGLPFRGKTLADTFTLVRNAQFERPSTLRDDVPQAVDRWFERAFHMERSQRFSSAAEMLQGWQAAASSSTGTAFAPAPPMGAPPMGAPSMGVGAVGAQPGPGPSLAGPPPGQAGWSAAAPTRAMMPMSEGAGAAPSSRVPVVAALAASAVALIAVIIWLLV